MVLDRKVWPFDTWRFLQYSTRSCRKGVYRSGVWDKGLPGVSDGKRETRNMHAWTIIKRKLWSKIEPVQVGMEPVQTPSPSHWILWGPESRYPHIQAKTTRPPWLVVFSKSCSSLFWGSTAGQVIGSHFGTSADHIPETNQTNFRLRLHVYLQSYRFSGKSSKSDDN